MEVTGKDGEKLEAKQPIDMEAVKQVALLQAQMEQKLREEARDGSAENNAD